MRVCRVKSHFGGVDHQLVLEPGIGNITGRLIPESCPADADKRHAGLPACCVTGHGHGLSRTVVNKVNHRILFDPGDGMSGVHETVGNSLAAGFGNGIEPGDMVGECLTFNLQCEAENANNEQALFQDQQCRQNPKAPIVEQP